MYALFLLLFVLLYNNKIDNTTHTQKIQTDLFSAFFLDVSSPVYLCVNVKSTFVLLSYVWTSLDIDTRRLFVCIYGLHSPNAMVHMVPATFRSLSEFSLNHIIHGQYRIENRMS